MTHSDVTIFVCVSCRRANPEGEGFHLPGRALADVLHEKLAQTDASHIKVTPVECLAVCNRPSTVAMVGPDRWTYLVGDLDAERHADQIIAAATAFQKTENGIVPWKERPEAFRKGVIARVPPLGFSMPEQDRE
ncbi:MAG: DUF1636 domain-containing protein [Hyphomicrobium zavarzinii]|jgi:predicted metal-binding protein|uniref:DUF1636 family protein n=1 Tax=Hyphomicrobium TaxID=81 RepID=UPI00039EC548|nr:MULTISPECIES: DUF1636 domain-containing protein [Hyphomicrobium]MBL8844672.1 DUF1636 domain-containing protein [Hyphomicrobium zavarzinii]WBT39354.1 DUF1636 domain-containing protein [Hyphomicrobium sp. DMF-1]HML42553.1 DUF1636 domain-containing protein [Hyphomicrobium zavarzinii]